MKTRGLLDSKPRNKQLILPVLARNLEQIMSQMQIQDGALKTIHKQAGADIGLTLFDKITKLKYGNLLDNQKNFRAKKN